MNYYLSSDLNDGFIYIAPLGKVERPFLIRFPNKYQADEYLRKLKAKLYKDPNQDEKGYSLIEVVTHPAIPGKVHVFSPKT